MSRFALSEKPPIAVDVARRSSLTDAIRAIACSRPDATAVEAAGARITYGELWSVSGHIAARLRAARVCEETLVGVECSRSVEQVLAVAAIHRAGGAAVLLDPAWPEPRRLALRRELPVHSVLDFTQVSLLRNGSGEPPLPLATPDRLAFVVYTSGSTGRPKAVGIPHRSVLHCARTHADSHSITADSRHGWVTSTGSSAGIGEVWPALANGACVVAALASDLESGGAMRDWALRERISHLFAPTALARLLYEQDWPGESAMRTMSIGGEAARRWAPRTVPFAVTVDYGSAEANGVSSGLARPDFRLSAAEAPQRYRDEVPPIGLPWPDVDVHVVDDSLAELGVGEHGELVVAGPELARGYLNDAAETARRFVPDPFGPPGSRMLRTGDLVSRDAEGVLYFHGRRDDVVQVRGHTVALAEVEEAVRAVLGCDRVVAVGLISEHETRVGVVVVAEDADLTDWPARLGAALPAHLVPSELRIVATLPLLPGGKIDRAAAAALLRAAEAAEAADLAVDDPVLTAVLESWQANLPAGHHDPDADFYLSGGTSLTAVALITRLEQVLGVRLRVVDVLRETTPRALADLIRTSSAVVADESGAVHSLHPAQRSLWLAAQQDPTGCGYNETIPLLLTGPLDVPALRAAWVDVLRRHDVLRTRFPLGADGLPQPVLDELAEPAFTVRRLVPAPGHSKDEAITAAIDRGYRQPFPLAEAPPIRAELWLPDGTTTTSSLLVITAHHLLLDADSGDQLIDELLTCYVGGAAAATLDPAPRQFANCVQPALSPAQVAAAVARFGPWPHPITPPGAVPRSGSRDYTGGRVSVDLPDSAVLALRTRAPQWRTTALVVAIASAQLVVADDSGEVCVGTPVSVRDLCGGIGVVGPMLNTVLVRNPVTRSAGLGAAVAEARRALLEATEHSAVPFDEFVRAAAPPDQLRGQPVQFYVNVDTTRVRRRAGRLIATRLRFDPHRAHYDLRFELAEHESGLTARLEYDGQRYDQESADSVLRTWVELLTAGLADPDRPAEAIIGPVTTVMPAPSQPPTAEVGAARDDLADAVTGVWLEAFGLDRLDPVADTFFSLGGTSLLAAQVALRMTIRLGVDVPLVALFEAPTVMAMCALLRGRNPDIDAVLADINELWQGASPTPPIVEPDAASPPTSGHTRMSAGQEQLWISARLGGTTGRSNQRFSLNIPILLSIAGPLDESRLRRALAQVADRQESWRTGFEVRDGSPVQVVHPAVDIPWAVVELSALPATEQERRFAEHRAACENRQFDLTRPPLLDVTLYRFGPDRHRLLAVVHHIVFDGGSAVPMLRDLDAYYRGVPPDPVRLPTSYRQHSDRQRAELDLARRAELAAFWRGFLGRTGRDADTRAQAWSTTGARPQPARLTVPADLVTAIRSVASSNNASVFQVLLAALHVLIVERTGRVDQVIGVPMSLRDRADCEPVIGYFLNMVPIRVCTEQRASFGDVVAASRLATLTGFEHGHLPYPLIRKAAPHRLDAVLAIGPVPRALRLGEATVDLDVRSSESDVGVLSIAVLELVDGLVIEVSSTPGAGETPAEILDAYLTVLRGAVFESGWEAACGNAVG